MENEYFYSVMYGWLENPTQNEEVEHTSGFDFARFIGQIMEVTQNRLLLNH